MGSDGTAHPVGLGIGPPVGKHLHVMRRVQWTESRRETVIFVIADQVDARWEFYEREAWETPWHPIPPRSDLVARAEALAAVRS